MIALKITNTKDFMKGFLAGDLMDSFLVIEGLLISSITYSFDGHLNMDFFPIEERDKESHPYEFISWQEMKSTVFSLVKGNNTPLSIKFMLQLIPEKAAVMLQKESPLTDFSKLKALLLNIKYESGQIILTTGTSYETFVMNKEADIIWDKNIQKFLSAKKVDFEIM